VSYNNYILLNGWQGNLWYELSPTFKILFNATDIPAYNDTSLLLMNTTANLGLYIADIRVFYLSSSDSWG
jgi:hypothetical protein